MVVKNQKKDMSTKTEEVLKISEVYFKEHILNTEFPHDKNILQSIPNMTPGRQPSAAELIITKEEVGKDISLFKAYLYIKPRDHA